MRIAVGADDLENGHVPLGALGAGHFQDGDVKRAPAQVEDGHFLVFLLAQPVGQCRGGRLVDDAGNLQTGDLAGVLGRLTLRVVEVRGHCDHGLVDFVSQIGLSGLL